MFGIPANGDKERLAIKTLKESNLYNPMEQATGRHNFRRECARDADRRRLLKSL